MRWNEKCLQERCHQPDSIPIVNQRPTLLTVPAHRGPGNVEWPWKFRKYASSRTITNHSSTDLLSTVHSACCKGNAIDLLLDSEGPWPCTSFLEIIFSTNQFVLFGPWSFEFSLSHHRPFTSPSEMVSLLFFIGANRVTPSCLSLANNIFICLKLHLLVICMLGVLDNVHHEERRKIWLHCTINTTIISHCCSRRSLKY